MPEFRPEVKGYVSRDSGVVTNSELLRGAIAEGRKNGKSRPATGQLLPSGRIVPTEARPSELSGCIVGGAGGSVKNKSDN